jgi:hypothetical protein
MKDINVKSVRYPETVDQKFEKIAIKLGRAKRLVFIQMVDYFYKSKKVPVDLNDELLNHNVDVINNQQALAAMSAEVARLMEAILQGQKSKEVLKAQFLSVFEGYVRLREAFTMMTSGREKEELIASVKEQVRLL